MSKASVMVKTVLVFLLAALLLTSCGLKEYNGFKVVRQDGEWCVEIPVASAEKSITTVPLSYYQVSEACVKDITDMFNGFNIESEGLLESYEQFVSRIERYDSTILPEKSQKSFGKWVSAHSGENVNDSSKFVEKYGASVRALLDVLSRLGKQDPLLNTAFTAEDFFALNGRTKDVQDAASFIELCYPGVHIISDFSERTRFVIDESKYVDFPVAATINKEGEASLNHVGDVPLQTFKMPVLFYYKLRSIAQTLAKNYNAFSESNKQVVTELFESCSAVRSLMYNLLEFFPEDSDKAVLLDWLRYVVSLDREDAQILTGGLASFCRAQWLYSYEIISVLDDINWNCSYYDDKEYAVRKTWNDYVNKKQDLLDALAFFEETFGGITFIRNLDL